MPLLIEDIKKLVIIGLASDDELIESLVLKGGSAVSLFQNASDNESSRTSYDLDFSWDEDFELDELDKRIERTLDQTFSENGYKMMDYKFAYRPRKPKPDTADFWAGYLVTFKLVSIDSITKKGWDRETSRRNAIALNGNSPTFEIDISRYEYTGKKQKTDFEGYTIYVYSAEMIAFEKLRALCQQLPQYKEIVPSANGPCGRSRDFYDIVTIMELHAIDVHDPENLELIKNIFYSKRVPVEFINLLRDNLYLHRDNWASFKDTVKNTDDLESFDYYVDAVLSKFENLRFPEDNIDATF